MEHPGTILGFGERLPVCIEDASIFLSATAYAEIFPHVGNQNKAVAKLYA